VIQGAKASIAWFDGDWSAAVRYADAGAELLRASCHGVAFELAVLDNWGLSALALKGDIRELVKRVQASLQDAERRDDRVLWRSSSLGQAVIAWLALDQPQHAIERADRTIAWWPDADHRSERYFFYLAKAQAFLYQGDAHAAHALMLKHWPQLESNKFLTIRCVRDELWNLHARTALAMAVSLRERGTPVDLTRSATFVCTALDDARLLSRHGLACGQAWATLVRAGAAILQEKTRESAEALSRAVSECDRTSMALHREVARYCHGVALGEERGRGGRTRALAWFEAQGVQNPLAMIRMVAPACLPIESAA